MSREFHRLRRRLADMSVCFRTQQTLQKLTPNVGNQYPAVVRLFNSGGGTKTYADDRQLPRTANGAAWSRST